MRSLFSTNNLAEPPDPQLISVCMTEGRVLVTLDTDFGNILAYPPDRLPGIIVIRTDDQSKPALLSLLPRFISALEVESINHKLWIVEKHRIRIRGLE